jgi:hypothetical protein
MVQGSDVELIFFLLRSKVGIGFDTFVFNGVFQRLEVRILASSITSRPSLAFRQPVFVS